MKPMPEPTDTADLLDWRRRVADLYAAVRAADDPATAWRRWRRGRDRLFATHPQSPIEDLGAFEGLRYFDHDPAWRLVGAWQEAPLEGIELIHSGGGTTPARRVGRLAFESPAGPGVVDAWWLDAYGGGLFVPLRDATAGEATYGGGRYLLDTVKGADLGSDTDGVVLDFNFAYHPSCVHSDRWSCPLAPPGNVVAFEVPVGERLGG